MKIQTAETVKLNGIYNHKINFNPDINIITGLNGSGKSSFIKLIWYMISGNLERIPFEIEVSFAKVVTDVYTVSVELSGGLDRDSSIRGRSYKVDFKSSKHTRTVTVPIARGASYPEIDEINKFIAENAGSLFFPTYRRVEWGSANSDFRRISSRSAFFDETSALEIIGTTLDRVSKEISVNNHKFVTSASVDDIIALLTDKYANISRSTNLLQSRLSEKIISQIESYDDNDAQNSSEIMHSIKREIESTNSRRDRLMMPLSKFTELASSVLGKKKVRLTRFLNIGDETAREVPAYLLSAGEKQMISFLCYNALFENIPIIIDEPELSLHTDWQRILFPLLMSQVTGNQLITVTHSPFIYSKYRDREIIFNRDRGNIEDTDPYSLPNRRANGDVDGE